MLIMEGKAYFKNIYNIYIHSLFVLYMHYSGSLLWCMHRRRRWSLILQAPPTSHRAVDQIDNSPGQSARLRAYSVSHHCIDVVDTLESCEATLHSQTPQSLRVVGLDCEWVSKERGGQFPVALLQLAFLDGRCLLVRMCKIQTLPPTLTDILQDNKYYTPTCISMPQTCSNWSEPYDIVVVLDDVCIRGNREYG